MRTAIVRWFMMFVVAAMSAGCSHLRGVSDDSLIDSIDAGSLALPQTAKLAGAQANEPVKLAKNEPIKPTEPTANTSLTPAVVDLVPKPPVEIAALKKPVEPPKLTAEKPADSAAAVEGDGPVLTTKLKTSRVKADAPKSDVAATPVPAAAPEVKEETLAPPLLRKLADAPATEEKNSELPKPPASFVADAAVPTSPLAPPGDVLSSEKNRVATAPKIPRAQPREGETPRPLVIDNAIALTGKSEIDADALVAWLMGKGPVPTEGSLKSETEVPIVPPPPAPLVAENKVVAERMDPDIKPVSAVVPVENASDADAKPAAETAPRELDLARLHLCTEILGFARTQPREEKSLVPGERLLAYVEVLNFSSTAREGLFETRLSGRVTMEDSSGKMVFSQEFGDIVDQCIAPRKDFFCHFLFTVPSTLPPGPYKLRLQVKDQANGNSKDQVLDLLVGDPVATEDLKPAP